MPKESLCHARHPYLNKSESNIIKLKMHKTMNKHDSTINGIKLEANER